MANVLTAEDAGFEGGTVGTWVLNTEATVANTAVQADTGTKSLLVTHTAGTGPCIVNTGFYDGVVSAGDSVTIGPCRIRSATNSQVFQFYIDWYTAGHAFISSDFDGGQASSTAAWTTNNQTTVTAPATAGSFVLNCQIFTTVAADVHYIDTLVVDVVSASIPFFRPQNPVYRM